jgi:hypothetical protein
MRYDICICFIIRDALLIWRHCQTNTPTLTGSMLSCSATGDPLSVGADIFLSQELQQGLLRELDSSCQSVTSECFQNVQELLVNPNTELETRQASVIAIAGAVLSGVLGILFPLFYKEPKGIPNPIYIPPEVIEEAIQEVSATVIVVITASGAASTVTEEPAITITPKPPAAVTSG